MTSVRCLLIFYCFILFIYLVYYLEPLVCTDVIVLRLLFIYFYFWDGIQNSVSNMCQAVLSNISIQSRVVHFYMYMASLMALAILCPSLPIILKYSIDVVWPVLLLVFKSR